MALDKTELRNAFRQTFQQARDEAWSSDQVAAALADAIDAFVRSGAVVGITTEVRDAGNTVIGTGSQTGTGSTQ